MATSSPMADCTAPKLLSFLQAIRGNTASRKAALHKFHYFCDIFSIPENQRLPASFAVLHSFILWACTYPDSLPTDITASVPFEPISTSLAREYLAEIEEWHIEQGWPLPLSEADHARIKFSLRGLENLQDMHKGAPRPPATLDMLRKIKSGLVLNSPFDACIWAIATCAFWGMMRLSEVSVEAYSLFDASRYLKRSDVYFGHEPDGKHYARLYLPSVKMTEHGKAETAFLAKQSSDLCPVGALENLEQVVPASTDAPLFSWRDEHGKIRPMERQQAMQRIRSILSVHGWNSDHSFRIGGAAYYLADGFPPELVRVAGRWRSSACEGYKRAREQVAHDSGNPNRLDIQETILRGLNSARAW